MKSDKRNYRIIIYLIIIMSIAYFLIYKSFIIDGFFPVGEGFEKRDWLAFFGNYVGVFGTILLGMIALRQNSIFKEENDKSQERINKINDELIQIQIADKLPFINVEMQDNLKAFSSLEESVRKGIEKKENRKVPSTEMFAVISPKEEEYFVFSQKIKNGEWRKAIPTMDMDYYSCINSKYNSILYKKLVFTNIGNNAAVNVLLYCNDKKISTTFNLGTLSEKVYNLVILEDLPKALLNFKIQFKSLDKQIYCQNFLYEYKLPDKESGMSYKFETTDFPQKYVL